MEEEETGGGSGTSQGCGFNWGYTGFSSVNGSDFTGIGTAQTLTTLTQFQGGNINGWVNFVVDGAMGTTSATYDMVLTLGGVPYKISYKALRMVGNPPFQFFQQGSLDISVNNLSIYSQQVLGTQNRTVFRIAREGNAMRFYQDGDLIATPTVPANTGAGAQVTVSTEQGGVAGRIHTTIFSPFCQELVPDFTISSLDCNSGTGSLSIPTVQGGTPPYFHYFDNANLDNIYTIPTPTVGWITTVDQQYRAATYYMGVGREITWQHVGTQLSNNVLSPSSIAFGASTSVNKLSSNTDGWLGFRKTSATGWKVGFIDAVNPSSDLYEFRGDNDFQSDIYIGGNSVATVQALLTDYLRISREGNQIKFYVNEVEVYSYPTPNTNELQAKFGFTQMGSTISYPTLSFCSPVDPPVITLTSTDLSACQGENVPVITPTTQNVTALRWYTTNPDGVFPRPSYVSGASFNPDPNYPSPSLAAGTYTYYVTGVDLNGQETPAQAITLTIHSLPSVSIDPVSVLCPNSSITLRASAQASTSSYQWFKDGNILTGETTRYLTLSQGGIYKVQVTTAQGCIATSERNISPLNFTLDLSYQTSSSGCGQVFLVTTSSINGISYKYQKKNSLGNWINYSIFYTYNIYSSTHAPVVPIVESGSYRIVSTHQGCTVYSNEIPVTIHPSTYSTITPTPSSCQGNPVTLSVQNYNPSYTYQWQQQVGGSWTNVGTTQSIIVPYLAGTTTANFKVITTDPITTCSSTTLRTISYLPSPTIATYTSFVESEVGAIATFAVATHTNTAYTYQWTGPSGFNSSSANPSISVSPNSYGEYILVVSNGGCSTTYRAIIAEKGVFATLKENLDASYYHTNREGKLYFKFDEKYGLGTTGMASISTFNYDFQEVNQVNLSKEYGYNWYGIDMSSFGVEGDQYVLHIKDELERRYVLRVKYATGTNKVSIGEDFTTCISQSTDLRTVRLDAMSYVDIAPYTISWYVSTDYAKINQLGTLSNTDREALLFAQEQNIEEQYSTTLFSTQQNYSN